MRRSVRIATLVTVALASAITPATASAAAYAADPVVAPTGAALTNADARDGDVAALVVDEAGRPTIVRVYAATATEARRKAAAVPGSDGVVVDVPVFASESTPVTAAAVGPDPGRPRQWHLDRLHMDDIPVPAVSATPTATATVAVLDTGVLASHEDFAPGQVLCSQGADFTGELLSNDGCVDPDGHGTHVAGIIGAVANNALGVVGVAAGIRILPVRVLGADGSGSSFDTVEGITYAADHGATVINLSLGGTQGAGVYDAAVAYARSKGVQVIASAGNNRQAGNAVGYPAAAPGVTSVAATDSTDTSASFSYSGPTVDIAAPGVNIYALGNTRTAYVAMSGTSMAAPMVAAVAALHRVANPASTEADATAALLRTADDLEAAGRDNNTGVGLIDPYELLTGAPRPGSAPPTALPAAPVVAPVAPPVSAPAPAPAAPAPAPGPVLAPAPPPAAPAGPPAPATGAPAAPAPPASGLPAAEPAFGVPAPRAAPALQPAVPIRPNSPSAGPVDRPPAASTRLLAPSVRPRQRLAITVANYRPGSTVQVTETYEVLTRTRTAGTVVTRTAKRTVVLATLRVPASGTLTASVLPVQTARTGRLAVTGTDRRGVRTGLSVTILVR